MGFPKIDPALSVQMMGRIPGLIALRVDFHQFSVLVETKAHAAWAVQVIDGHRLMEDSRGEDWAVPFGGASSGLPGQRNPQRQTTQH